MNESFNNVVKAVSEMKLGDIYDTIRKFHQPIAPPFENLRNEIAIGHIDSPSMQITESAYRKIMLALSNREREYGGILVGPTDSRMVSHFFPDKTGTSRAASFTFDHMALTRILKAIEPHNLDGKGFVHSHPSGYRDLSPGDMDYVRSVFDSEPTLQELLMPIVVDGEMIPYIIYPSAIDTPVRARLILIN